MHIEASLPCHQCREKADRTGACHEDRPRTPRGGACPDPFGMIPRLRHNAGRLQKHAQVPKGGVHLHRKLRLHAEALGAVAIALLDPLSV
jgi:hypothetical protein